MSMTERPKKDIVTLDEVDEILSRIARDSDGAQQIRALNMLRAKDSGVSRLPEPLSDAEVIDNLSRLIRAAGPTASMLAYRKAFPRAQRPLNHSAPKVTEQDIGGIDKAALPKTLRALYKMFPEIKRGGIPKGYPVHSGMAVQTEWVKKQAIRMLLDKEQRKLDVIATEAAPENEQEDADAPSAS